MAPELDELVVADPTEASERARHGLSPDATDPDHADVLTTDTERPVQTLGSLRPDMRRTRDMSTAATVFMSIEP